MSPTPRRPPRDERAEGGAAHPRAGRPASRRPRPAPGIRARQVDQTGRTATTAEIAALRAQLLRFLLTLPGVALGDSRLDADAAGIFVRVSNEDGTGFEMREFATLRSHPRWSLSVILPVDGMVSLQRLGWGRPRSADGSGPLLLELVRPRSEADVESLQRVLASAHRVASNAQVNPQGWNR